MEQEIRGELIEYLPQDLVNYIIVPYIIWNDRKNNEFIFSSKERQKRQSMVESMRSISRYGYGLRNYNQPRDRFQTRVIRDIRADYFRKEHCVGCKQQKAYAKFHTAWDQCIMCRGSICPPCWKKRNYFSQSRYCGCLDKDIKKMDTQPKNYSKYNLVGMNVKGYY
jgi:hypothetical protein